MKELMCEKAVLDDRGHRKRSGSCVIEARSTEGIRDRLREADSLAGGSAHLKASLVERPHGFYEDAGLLLCPVCRLGETRFRRLTDCHRQSEDWNHALQRKF